MAETENSRGLHHNRMRMMTCQKCNGQGWVWRGDEWDWCEECGGEGQIDLEEPEDA